MKYKIFYVILLLILKIGHSYAQTSTFHKTYGKNDGGSNIKSIQQTPDGGYVFFGHNLSFGPSIVNAWLVKVNSNGDTLWSKSYGLTASVNTWGSSVKNTSDGGFILTGWTNGTNSTSPGYYDAFLTKTDSLGNILWTKNFGGANQDNGYDVIQSADGGYVIAGTTMSFGSGYSDWYLLKTDSLGNMQWVRTIGNSSSGTSYSVIQTLDGSYVFAGDNYPDAYLVKIGANGNIVWAYNYNNLGISYSLVSTPDGGFALCGKTQDYKVYVLKTDSVGSILWSKVYTDGAPGGYAWAYKIINSDDGGFLIVGDYNNQAIMIKINGVGDTVLTKQFTAMSTASAISITPDKGILIGGNSMNLGVGNNDAYLIKTDSLGNSGCFTTPISISTNTVNTTRYINGTIGTSGGVTNNLIFNIVNTSPSICKLCEISLTTANYVYTDTALTVYFSDSSVNATEWEWYFGDFSPNSYSQNPIHTFTSPGNYYVCLTASNGCSTSQFCTNITITLTGIGENKITDKFNIFPNPSNGKIDIDIIAFDKPQLKILNVFGVQCYLANLTRGHNQIDIEHLPKGIYFLNIGTQENNETRKIIIQ